MSYQEKLIKGCQGIYQGVVDKMTEQKFQISALLDDLYFCDEGESLMYKFDSEGNLVICSEMIKKKIQKVIQEYSPIDITESNKIHDIKFNPEIKFILFPMKQGHEYSVHDLGLNRSKIKTVFDGWDGIDVLQEGFTIGNFIVKITGLGLRYQLLDQEGKEIASFKDESAVMQCGDDGTLVYTYGNDIIIHNEGDVSSIVYIKIGMDN